MMTPEMMSPAALLRDRPGLFEHLDRTITTERAVSWFPRIADTPAPSQCARQTRGRMLETLLGEAGAGEGIRFHRNLWKTGNVAVELGARPAKPLWLLAHLDTPSYALDLFEDGRYRLLPLCYHMSRGGRREAVAVGYDLDGARFDVLAHGAIVTERDGLDIFFETGTTDLPKGTRVVDSFPTVIDPDTLLVRGNIDNAFAATALLLAAVALDRYQPEVLMVFPDEEEGQTGAGNQSFCKGSARLFNRCPPELLPEAVVVSDVHEAKDMADGRGSRSARPGRGAAFSELSSRGRGGVTPPPLLAFTRGLAAFLADHGVHLQENRDGYISRSDSISAMLYVQNVALVGYLGSHRHFDSIPEAHLGDLVHLAKTLAVYGLIVQSEEWRQVYLT